MPRVLLLDFALVATLALFACPLTSAAQGIYKYVEKDGTIVYTNVPPPGSAHASKVHGTFHRAPDKTRNVKVQAVSTAEFDEYIDAAAKRYKIPQALLRAVMHTESNFDPKAVSRVGASGLMQLMPKTAQEMYVKDIFDIRDNIEGGARYLRTLANMYDGDMVKMVAAYNAGPDAVKKYGGQVPPYPETRAYVTKVIRLYYQYKEQARLAEQQTAPK